MELKVSILEYLYKKSPYLIQNIIVKLRVLFGYKYCISCRTPIGYMIDDYPRSRKYIKLYASYYKEYCRYKEVEIVENKYVKR